jgi:predicted ester cyclase
MSILENKALVLRFVEEVQNQHNLTVIDELLSPDFVDRSGNSNLPGPEGVRGFFTMMFAAFPDMHFTILQQLAESDKVVTHKTFHGTHRGTFMGIPPTDKEVSFDVIDILTVNGSMITEHWTVSDLFSLMQQLGAVTAPA